MTATAEKKMTVVGWIITVVLSVAGAYGTITSKIYEVDKRISIVEQRLSILESSDDKQNTLMQETRNMFYDIKTDIAELKSLKADKKFVN